MTQAAHPRLAALRRQADRPWVAGAVAAGWAALAGYALVLTPALLAWLAGGAQEPVGGVLRLAGQMWLVVNGADVVFGGGRFGLAPLGLTLLLLLLLRHAGRTAVRRLRAAAAAGDEAAAADPEPADPADQLGGGERQAPPLGRRAAATVACCATGAYALAAGAIASFSALPNSFVEPVPAAVTSAVLAALGIVLGVLPASGLLPDALGRLPAWVRRALRPAATAAGTLLAGGAALVGLALVTHLPAVVAIHRALDAGVLGGVVLAAVGLAYLVNAAVWAAAYAAGPGFALGVGTTVGVGGVTLGALPGAPMLGAVPEQVPPPVQLLALTVPLVAGALAGRRLAGGRAPGDGTRRLALDGLAVGALCGLLTGLAASAASGPGGPQLLAQVGPVPWQVAFAVTVEVGVAAAATAVLLRWRDRPPPTSPVDEDGAAAVADSQPASAPA